MFDYANQKLLIVRLCRMNALEFQLKTHAELILTVYWTANPNTLRAARVCVTRFPLLIFLSVFETKTYLLLYTTGCLING